MILEIIIATLIGVIAGTFTGIIPGIHTNLLAVLILASIGLLLGITSPLIVAVFIVSMSITNTVTDSIPSIFLGAPDSEQVLSVLPGHKLLLQGQGYQAVALTVIGSVLAILIITPLAPILIPLVKFGYPLIQVYIPYILVISSIFLILREVKSRFWALTVFLLSGTLGIATLNSNISDPLFPLFSGLFGTSGLILSIFEKTKIPKQVIEFPKIKTREIVKSISAGFGASFITGLLPGVGAAQAAIIASSVFKKITSEAFLILTGSINTFVMAVSFIALISIEKARNGSIVAVSKILESITNHDIKIFFAVSLIAVGLSAIITLKLSKIFSKIMEKVNYKKLTISIILLITILVLILTGPLGLLILIVSTFLGMIPTLKGIAKNHLMGSLLLPVILFFLL